MCVESVQKSVGWEYSELGRRKARPDRIEKVHEQTERKEKPFECFVVGHGNESPQILPPSLI